MTCAEFRTDVDALALGALSPAETAAMHTHLAGCQSCAVEYRAARDAAGQLLLGVPQVRAPGTLREAVLGAIRAKAPPVQAETAPTETGEPSTPEAAPVTAKRGRLVWLSTPIRVPALAAAAFVALAVGLVAWAAAAQAHMHDLSLSRDRARVEAAGALSTSDLSRTAVQQVAAILAMPHTITAGLESQESWPASSGAIVWNPDMGRCIVLVRGLTPLETGQQYHLWFVAGTASWDGGVLKPDATGTAEQVVSTARWSIHGGYTVNIEVQPYDSDGDSLPVLTGVVSPSTQ